MKKDFINLNNDIFNNLSKGNINIHLNKTSNKNLNKLYPPKKKKFLSSRVKPITNSDTRLQIKKSATSRKINSISKYPERLNRNNVLSKKSSEIINYSKENLVYFRKKQNNQTTKIVKDNNKTKKEEELSDFELNELEYWEAVKLDKRTFIQIYFSKLKREHLILFTFFVCDDLNLLYIKYAKFMFLISTDMAMNVIFFSDDSMHKLYLNYGKYDFVQQIPKMVYSTIISQILDVFLCFLTMTDRHIYELKKLRNITLRTFEIFRYIRIKLIIFFIFTFILFLSYWYAVSAFCAVYANTQITFIKDSIFSFLLSALYQFILYLFPSILRLCSLKCKKIELKCIYKISDIIPFF